MKIIATSRKARRDYEILETYEAGIELRGTEVKSLRTKGCSIEEAFGRIENGEAFLYNLNIPEYEKSFYFRAAPKRTRRLLLHKKEIKRLIGLTSQRGLTLIPLKIYFNDKNFVKVEISLAKGKLLYDKRRKIKEELVDRETRREMKNFNRTREGR
ncbi:MAG: SsrA-binding protein SmpB [Candidatus Omnitrophica bacterium]|nr:SsrA-binding protein SmpB [Candidatus Omnitrophota bacterium]